MHVARNGKYWQGKYSVSGKTYRIGLGAHPSRSSAMNALVRRIADEGLVVDSGKVTIAPLRYKDWITKYINERKDLCPETLCHTKRDCEEFLEFVGLDTALADVGRQHARAWALSLKRQPSRGALLSMETIVHKVKRVRTCFRYAVENDPPLVDRNPFYGRLEHDAGLYRAKQSSATWRYVSPAEFEAVFQELPTLELKSLAMLARHAGLRLTEATSLAWKDILLADNVSKIHVQVRERDGRRDANTKQQDREVPISLPLKKWLCYAMLEQQPGSVGPCSTVDKCDRAFHDARRRAGVAPYGKPVHTLRKSLITDWIDSTGVPTEQISLWVGAGVGVIYRHYYERFPDRRMGAIVGKDPTIGRTPQCETFFTQSVDNSRNIEDNYSTSTVQIQKNNLVPPAVEVKGG